MNEKELYESINLLKDPDEIVRDLSDKDQVPIRLSSMTNHTYKIKVNGNDRVIRIPSKGTDRFINRSNEYLILQCIKSLLTCKIIYNNEYGLLVTEALPDNYRPLTKDDNYEIVAVLLSSIHNTSINGIPFINLIDELHDYRSINDNKFSFNNTDSCLEHEIENFIDQNQHTDVVVCQRDLMYSNIMINEDSILDSKIIDWEYSGCLNYGWDIGCFLSEYRLLIDNNISISDFINKYSKYSGKCIDTKFIKYWIAAVDYVWSIWSLAKSALGEDNMEYGQQRYNNFINMMEEIRNEK